MSSSPNVLGAVSVQIIGDTSRLAADFARAQGLAARAGSAIGSSLAAGIAPGVASVTGLVDQFGRSIQSSIAPVQNLTAAGEKLAAALIQIAGAEEAAAGAAGQLGAAHAHAVTDIQAVGGGLRVLEGTGGIRAAERLLSILPGVASLFQAAFPVIGAVALFEALDKVAEKMTEAAEAAETLKKATSEADAEFENFVKTADRLNVQRQTQQFGRGAGLKLEATLEEGDAGALDKKAQTLRKDAQRIRDKYADTLPGSNILSFGYRARAAADASQAKETEAETASAAAARIRDQERADREQAVRAIEEDNAALAKARASRTEQAATGTLSLEKQKAEEEIKLNRATEQEKIEAIEGPAVRAAAAADADVKEAQDRLAKLKPIFEEEYASRYHAIVAAAQADKVGKAPTQQAEVEVNAQKDILAAHQKAQGEITKLYADESEAESKAASVRVANERKAAVDINEVVRKGFDELSQGWKEAEARAAEATAKILSDVEKVAEVQATAAGEIKLAQLQGKRIASERAYSLEILHTNAEVLAHARELAGIEDQQRQERIDALQDRLAIAKARDNEVEASRIQAEIDIQSVERANARAEAEAKIAELKRKQSFAGRVLGQLPQGSPADQLKGLAANTTVGAVNGIADALARATVSGHKFGQAFAQIGRQLAQQSLGKLLSIGLDAGLRALLGLIPAFTSVAAAQTAAVAAGHAATSAANVGNVFSFAAAGSAAAFASVLEALPFPANVAVAPAVAAAQFVEISGYAPIAAFASGGRIAADQIGIVGDGGEPEFFVPDSAGTIIPFSKAGASGRIAAGLDGINPRFFVPDTGSAIDGRAGGASKGFDSSKGGFDIGASGDNNTQTIHIYGGLHAHGVQSAERMVRDIPKIIRSRSSKGAPYSS